MTPAITRVQGDITAVEEVGFVLFDDRAYRAFAARAG